MKFKQIISNVAEMLGLNDVVDLINDGSNVTVLNDNMNYRLLLRCTSLVVANLATHYSELTTTQRITAQSGRINFSSFDNPPTSIKEVRRTTGERVRFATFIDHIALTNIGTGSFDVTYTYVPKIVTGNELNPFPLPSAAIEYGIMAEYAFIQGMLSEAQIWNEKFTEMIFSVKRKCGKSLKMPRSF